MGLNGDKHFYKSFLLFLPSNAISMSRELLFELDTKTSMTLTQCERTDLKLKETALQPFQKFVVLFSTAAKHTFKSDILT